MDHVDSIVVGAGIVGIAVARALALRGMKPLLIERESVIGSGISARNSEVIHAGIYYPQASRKAQFCVAGRRLLYDFCRAHSVPHRRCGKLIVATSPQQLPALAALQRSAAANGVDDLQWLDATVCRQLEPTLQASAALLSPSTGIVDCHALMIALLGEAETHGAQLVLNNTVNRINARAGMLQVSIGAETTPVVTTSLVVNCAGLDAAALAARVDGLPAQQVPAMYYAKGSYFTLQGRSPFSHLVYPLPEPGGLGVHLTLDLAGRARFGPDVEWIDTPQYDVDAARSADFYAAIRRYWPDLQDGRLQPGYAGVRPKLSGPGAVAADFRIDGPADHGVPGLINLFGIESPGLTSALAIAEQVCELAGK